MPDTLDAWLAWLEARNTGAPIVLGLKRVRPVAARLGLTPDFPLISVAGTNGKGSTCAYLEAMLTAAGLRVGVYTSPHLLRYNERVRIAGVEATDAELVEAFAAVETARCDVPSSQSPGRPKIDLAPSGGGSGFASRGPSLTYFEHGTLAAMWLFMRARLDVAVLEVGLGGRLDAVNLWDADCAVVTGIDLDHQAFLGDTRAAIGAEKAGIFRAGRVAICGDADPPDSLLDAARATGARLWRAGREFVARAEGEGWSLRLDARDAGDVADAVTFPALPAPALPGAHQLGNAACAMLALHALRARLPVPRQAMREGLLAARLPGRFQVIGHAPLRVVDVAHNPQSARALAALLRQAPPGGGRRIAVAAMLADKDIAGVLTPLLDWADDWHVASLPGPRGLDAAELARELARSGHAARTHADPVEAWRAACEAAGPADTIVAFGSFLTVAAILEATQRLLESPASSREHG